MDHRKISVAFIMIPEPSTAESSLDFSLFSRWFLSPSSQKKAQTVTTFISQVLATSPSGLDWSIPCKEPLGIVMGRMWPPFYVRSSGAAKANKG